MLAQISFDGRVEPSEEDSGVDLFPGRVLLNYGWFD
jgi:hypothetical protein